MLVMRCPLCRAALTREPRRWHCAQGHSFDVAREGYVNLLPVQNKKSRDPGDTPDSVRARRAFLEAGHYQPLRDTVHAWLDALSPRQLLDIGCGEGYYTRAMATVAGEVVGVDIAKPAVQLAARRSPDITWLVASAVDLPLPDRCVDAVTSLFSPLPVSEMRRVLRDDGHVLVVTPAADHLWQVREGLFGEVRAHEPDKFLREFETGFQLVTRDEIRVPLTLESPALAALLAMTPYAWKARADRRAALEAVSAFSTEAAFSLMLFRRV